MREELSTILSNRSAAFLEAGDYLSALVDSETVIQLKRPWSKGHFRKARALMALEEYQEAREAINLGLSFEPKNLVRVIFLISNFPTLTGFSFKGNEWVPIGNRDCHFKSSA